MMKNKKLVIIMIIVAIAGAAAGYYKFGGYIVEKITNLVGLALGIWFASVGIKVNKDFPDRTVNIFKPVKLGKFLVIAGIVVFIVNLVTLFAPQFKG